MTLAQGLEIAVREKWVTKSEAKAEFRANVRTVKSKDELKKALEETKRQLEELEKEEA